MERRRLKESGHGQTPEKLAQSLEILRNIQTAERLDVARRAWRFREAFDDRLTLTACFKVR